MSVMQDEALEVWELNIPGRVSVVVSGEYGRPRTVSAMGKGQRLRLTKAQRLIAQEQIRSAQNDPFRNGMMYRVNRSTLAAEAAAEGGEPAPADPAELPSDDELRDDELVAIFELEGEDFREAIGALSEVNVRRLKDLAIEHDAKASQVGAIQDFIAETYPVGGDTPTYREMQAVPPTAI